MIRGVERWKDWGLVELRRRGWEMRHLKEVERMVEVRLKAVVDSVYVGEETPI
jgi:hypothetical protein